MFNMEKVLSIAATVNLAQQVQEAALDVEGGGGEGADPPEEISPAAADAADAASAAGGVDAEGQPIINTPKGIAVITF